MDNWRDKLEKMEALDTDIFWHLVGDIRVAKEALEYIKELEASLAIRDQELLKATGKAMKADEERSEVTR
jgi:uncharacterized pyridoxal phosphate-containing UPF0001 family protein